MAKTKGGPKTIYETINGFGGTCTIHGVPPLASSVITSARVFSTQLRQQSRDLWGTMGATSVNIRLICARGLSKMSKEPGGFLISKASKHMWLLTVWNHALFGEHRSLGCSPAMKVHSPNRSDVVWNSSPHLDMFCPRTKRCLKAYDPYGL